MTATPDKYCIIGAGASGLAVAKNFATRNIPFEVLERESDLGGLWNIATPSGIVYESTHLVSCISSTGFDDLPMLDEDYPEYPSHDRILGYFRDFAKKFGLEHHIRYNQAVEQVRPLSDGTCEVSVKGESAPRRYRGVVVANGHHETPRQPAYPGTFTGEVMHSKAYKSQRQVRDKRVLVVGAGNSACDIIKDAAHASGEKVVMSLRRGTWFVPKFVIGFPTLDVISNLEWVMAPLPRGFKSRFFGFFLKLLQGPPSRYRLPDPLYRFDQAHPTMSDDIPRLAAHGRIVVRPEILRYEGRDVVFTDGTREEVDLIIFATGYELGIPFLDRDLFLGTDGRPRLFLNTLHPTHEGLFFAGLIQANGSIWRLADYQGRLIANTIVARSEAPEEYRALREQAALGLSGARKGQFVASDRHKLEANYFDYARLLKRTAASLRTARTKSLPTVARAATSLRAEAAE